MVLGASAGTGAAISRTLAQRAGLNVFGVHRGNHNETAAALNNNIRATGRSCHLRVANAGSAEGAAAGADEVLEVAGPKSVRVLVHSIADASYGRFTSGGEDQLHPKQIIKTFDRMTHSFLYWVQELLKRDLLADGARVIGLTNPLIDSVVDRWGLVTAAKASLDVYSRMLAFELAPRGYRVMLVKFGLVETEAIRMVFSDEEWNRLKRDMIRRSPTRRLCTVEEVAEFVVLLLGKAGDWFNGATIDYACGEPLIDSVFNRSDYEVQA